MILFAYRLTLLISLLGGGITCLITAFKIFYDTEYPDVFFDFIIFLLEGLYQVLLNGLITFCICAVIAFPICKVLEKLMAKQKLKELSKLKEDQEQVSKT